MLKVLILGVNGFIGHHLTRHIIETTDWEVYGMDMQSDRVAPWLDDPRFHFFEGDITINKEWIEYHVKKCDVVLPLVAIATPATYVREPLRVFELDFEANLPIVRQCLQVRQARGVPLDQRGLRHVHRRGLRPRIVEPGLRPDQQAALDLRLRQAADGPRDPRLRQQEGLRYTLFRPFNWIGPGLDSLHTPKEGSSRVITQFLGHIVRGEPIRLVDGGSQQRAFTYVDDGIAALVKIIANEGGVADQQDLQHRQPGQQPLDPRAGRDDAAAGARRCPNTARPRRRCS